MRPSLSVLGLLACALPAAPARAETGGDSGAPAEGCDLDLDGHDAYYCGGDDCNDLDGAVHPAAEELPDDGTDQDCDGFDRTVTPGESPRLLSGGAGSCATLPGRASTLGALLALLTLLRRRPPCAR